MNFRNMVAVLAFLCSYSLLRADTEISKEAFDQVTIISSGFSNNDAIAIYFHNGSSYAITSALVHVTIPGTKVDWNYSVDNQNNSTTGSNRDGEWTLNTGLYNIDKKSAKIEITKIYGTKQ